MLKELYIKNMAVIGEVRLQFAAGFHIFTGETGAGKSILVEAIGLILGGKVKNHLIRAGEDLAIVEATFDVGREPFIQKFLQDEALAHSENPGELIIKRQIQSDGHNKVFINHQRASLNQLQRLSAELIDFTGQYDQLQLLKSRKDREILDAFLKNTKPLLAYQEQYQKALALHQSIQAKENQLIEKDERLQWIEFQLSEIGRLPVPTEAAFQRLLTLRGLVKNQDVIQNFATKTEAAVLQASESLRDLLSMWQKQSLLGEVYPKADDALVEIRQKLDDFSFGVSQAADKARPSEDFSDLQNLEEQLYRVEKLKRKFGPEFADILAKQKQLQDEKTLLETIEIDLKHLRKKFEREFESLRALAVPLRQAREDSAKVLSRQVEASLKDLQMASARFEVRVSAREPQDAFVSYQSDGADDVAFWLSPNPGLGFQPLARIASGGETSRLFLAIKKVLSEKDPSGTFIFDEIDTGISGAAVELTGHKLKDLAKTAQVFCVTHHAQIASLADRHFFVTKAIEKGKTLTRVHVLSADERVQELARLMGGVKITDKNLAYAQELLNKKK